MTNFKSYSECYIDFEKFNGLYQIAGSVGSGKTTIGEALLWGLFGSIKGKTNPELIKWGEKRMSVEMALESKGDELKITRGTGSKSSLDVFKNGQQVIAPNKNELQRILEEELYDCSRMPIESLCLISFDSFKSISSFGMSAKRDFLDNVLGFSLLSDYINIVSDEIKKTKSSISELDRELSGVNGEIAGVQRSLVMDGECTDEEWQQTKDSIQKNEKELQALRKERDREMSEYRKRILSDEKELSVYVADGKKLKSDVEYLKRGICPTCGARLDTSMLGTYTENLDSIREQWKIVSNHKAETESEMKACQMSHDALINDKSGKLSELNYRLSQMNMWRSSRKSANESIESLESRKSTISDGLKKNRCDLDDWNTLKTELDFSVRKKLLSNITPRLNDILSIQSSRLRFPYHIEFDDEFCCVITDGGIEISVSSLSAGQKKLADMSIIISILELLMKGVNFNIRFFDELLSNMDDELRECVCGCLKDTFGASGITFLISHAKLPEGLLDGTVEVERNSRSSNMITS